MNHVVILLLDEYDELICQVENSKNRFRGINQNNNDR